MSPKNGCGLCKVSLNNITVKRGHETLIKDISFSMSCSELTALIGINGAGKTTLLRAILDEIEHEGNVYFKSYDGKKLSKITIGYVPQHLEFDTSAPVSVSDFLTAARSNHPVYFRSSKSTLNSIKESLEIAGATELIDKNLGDLSGGELQRVMLAQALYPTPELLILDEPLSGVDTIGSEKFYESIAYLRKNYHISVLMVSHDLELIKKYADSVVLLNKKILKKGSSKEVFESKEFKRTFDTEEDLA